MTAVWRALVTLLVAALCDTSAAARDCTAAVGAADQVVCAVPDLQGTDELMWSCIRQIENFVDAQEYDALVARQDRWRDEWMRSCLGRINVVVCLLANASSRIALLHDRREQIAGDRYVDQPIDVGGLPLVMKKADSSCQLPSLFIGDTRIMDCVYRIEPRARYRDAGIDALAFVANGGGATYICENFPMYVVAVRPGLPPDVVRVPDKHGNRRNAACLGVTRTSQGFDFSAAQEAGEDGWSQDWTPKDGLSAARIAKAR